MVFWFVINVLKYKPFVVIIWLYYTRISVFKIQITRDRRTCGKKKRTFTRKAPGSRLAHVLIWRHYSVLTTVCRAIKFECTVP